MARCCDPAQRGAIKVTNTIRQPPRVDPAVHRVHTASDPGPRHWDVYRVITSVTSATVAATSAVAGWGIALGVGGAILVIGLLIALELLGTTERPAAVRLRQFLRLTAGPLLVVFAVSVATKALLILAQQ
jgi:hypothetical protein